MEQVINLFSMFISADWSTKSLYLSFVVMDYLTLTQLTQNIFIDFIQCRPNVKDFGPTLYKCYTNVLCLLGRWLEVVFIHLDPQLKQVN